MRYNRYNILALFLLFMLINQSVYGQDKKELPIEFKGTITDNNKRPLSGVLIEVQEKNISATTDENGSFSISAFSNDVLIIKKAGFLTIQRSLESIANIVIILDAAKTDAGEEDNVEIPFGTRKRRQITSAITSITTDHLPQVPVSDFKNVLSGRVAGLYLEQNSTQPGGDGTDFQIRGRSTFGGNSAKALVDGVEREFGDMDLNEIESISILKDAAALAWYGLRGGNGIVLITTKKGNANRSGIRFDAQAGVQSPDKMIRPLDSYNFAKLYNEASVNDDKPAVYNQAALDAYETNSDPFKFPNNNYLGDFLKKSSYVQRYVVSADGGNNFIRYFVLLSYFNQGGLFNNTNTKDYNSNIGFKKFNFRGNLDFNVTKDLTITLNAGGRSENRLSPGDGTTSVLSSLYNLPPNAFPIVNEDSSYGGASLYQTNPLAQLRERGYVSAIDRVLLASLNVRQRLDSWVKGLSANILFSYDAVGTYTSGLTQDYEVFDRTVTPAVRFRNKTPLAYRSASFTNNNRRNEFWAGFDYDRSFNKHTVNASIRGQRYVNASPERLDFRTQGLAARTDYSYNQKYFLQVVAGYSGSENFAPGNRYGLFPAVSAGWVISEEPFFKAGKILSYLKLRASHGTAGSSDIGGSRFPFESFYNRNPSSGGYTFGAGFSGTNSTNELSLGNPDITWETIRTSNAGLDFKLFRNALNVYVDVYKNRRNNILTTAVLPSILGQSLGQVNAGVVESKGIDAAMSYFRQIRKVSISLNGNILVARDKVIAENGQQGLPEYQKTIGKIAGSTLAFISDGMFQEASQVDNSPKQTLAGRVVPGDIRYKDIGGPEGKPDGIIDNLDRIRLNKREMPHTYYGFGTVIKYKLLDFSTQFQGVIGRTVNIQGIVNSGPFSFNQESLDRWTTATAATAKYPRLGLTDRGNNTTTSDFWLRDADFLRLKYIEVGISIPKGFGNRYHISDARFYVGGFNVYSFDKLDIDIDPEIPAAGRGSAYPYLRTWTVGLTIKL